MSIIKKIRRSLGINADDDDDIADFTQDEELSAASSDQPGETEVVGECNPPCPADDSLPADMLTAVVELFNSTQPEFVSRCLDTDAQKQYLLEHISADVAGRIRQAIKRAHDMGLQEWEQTRRGLMEEVETLRRQKEQLEQSREESKGERLSNQRQKRALTERVHDLEIQVSTLEAEKEQLSLENRSMLNKLRVAGLGEGAVDPQATSQMIEELERLREENAEMSAIRERIESMTAEKENAEAQFESRISALADSAAEAERRAGKLEKDLAESSQTVERLNSDMQQRDDIIRNLNLKLADALREADRLARKDAYDMSHLELTEIPDVIPTPDNEQQRTADKPVQKEKKARQKRGRRKRDENVPAPKRFSAIDELMDSDDWFVSTPPPRQEKPEKNDDDFGYKEPPKKNPPADDDRQLSLW